MNTGTALFAADGIFEGRKKGNVPQAKPGEPEFVGIAIGAQHGSITKDHETLDAALASLLWPILREIPSATFYTKCPPILGYCISTVASPGVLSWSGTSRLHVIFAGKRRVKPITGGW
jgi:hypothetical protein